jgi:hypothetical protein
MTDRDYFAAAALTRGMGVLGYDQIAKSCYEMADAMLRERERTNHDAAPEAKDRTAGELGGARVTGNTPTLTDEERAAIEKAIGRELDAEWYGGPEPGRVVALRGLLERLG